MAEKRSLVVSSAIPEHMGPRAEVCTRMQEILGACAAAPAVSLGGDESARPDPDVGVLR